MCYQNTSAFSPGEFLTFTISNNLQNLLTHEFPFIKNLIHRAKTSKTQTSSLPQIRLPERHYVKGGQEDKNVDIRHGGEELSRPELRHVLGEGVEILKYMMKISGED